MNSYIVYILLSLKDLDFYIGYSTDIIQRKSQHNEGLVLSTRNRRPLDLIFHEVYTNKFDAQRRERYFKTTAGKKTLRLMLRETLQKYKKNNQSKL